jgi:hypothetical protein
MEYQEAVDIQEAIRCNNLLDKENINNASQFSAPNPQPLLHTSDVTHNPLRAISNKVPALVNKLTPKPVDTKNQCLTSYDTNEIMVSFATSNQQSELAFQEYMRSKMETDKEKAAIKRYPFLMFLIEKS